MASKTYIFALVVFIIIGGSSSVAMDQTDKAATITSTDQIKSSLELGGNTTVFEQGDEIAIDIEIVNTATGAIELWAPDIVQKTVILRVLCNGETLAPFVKWSSPFTPRFFSLDPGSRRDFRLELSRLYPVIMPAGAYRVEVTVLPGKDLEINSGSIKFEVNPMPADIQTEYNEYLKAMNGGEHFDVIEIGSAFLDQYPESKFADDLCFELGKALIGLDRYEEAIAVYNRALESEGAAEWQKTEARWRIAWSHHDKGDIKEAIQVMKQVDSPNAAKYIDKWQAKVDAGKDH